MPRDRSLLTRLRERIDRRLIDALGEDTWEQITQMDAGQDEHGYDPFGFQPEFLKYIAPLVERLYRNYFRTEAHGLEHIPDSGPVLLIANHSGQIPIDGMMIGAACLLEKRPPRMIRSMVERWVPDIPFLSWIFLRAGQVVGTRPNARILLERGGCILAFPEGVRGISKTYDRAYQLETFGLGFMRLALETGTPIVPVGVVGAEEQLPAIYNAEKLGRLLGSPALPVTPTFPLLGLAGGVPLPVKYHLYFGEPLHFEGAPDDEDRIIRAHVEVVRDAIRELLATGLQERRGIFW
jgi:1-acyl-sn-glycerol-3-phosphate acyltransferase